ncbi:hypothetical protein BJY04DRAFT_186966 [Aspergillus karnatakaensis]|uniref:uncharacterized protein n=1 Tax=Aspergillus karnatakaensis TaxID=1810916 RepID=UPI003CCD96B4
MDSPQSDLKLAQVEKSGLAWLPFLNNIPCLFCSDIGDVITGKRALCSDSPCNRVPQNYDLLAASTASIKALGLRFGDRLDFSGISTSHASYRVSPSRQFAISRRGL